MNDVLFLRVEAGPVSGLSLSESFDIHAVSYPKGPKMTAESGLEGKAEQEKLQVTKLMNVALQCAVERGLR